MNHSQLRPRVSFNYALASTLLLCMCHAPLLQAQGLLGQKYVSAGYILASTHSDPEISAISEWAHILDVETRRPLTETLDLSLNAQFEWFGGTNLIGATPIEFDSNVTGISAAITKHFFPAGRLDPFASLGVGYANANIEASSGIISVSRSDDATALFWETGAEFRLTEATAILANIGGGDALDDFKFEEALFDSIYFEANLVHWWNEHWFSGILIGSDFDDTEIALGFFLGVGNW